MPQFDLDQVKSVLTEEEYKLFQLTLNKDRLRATKPTEKKCGDKLGEAYYVWRMTAFYLAGFHPHNSMPVCADLLIDSFYLYEYEEDPEKVKIKRAQYDARIAELDEIVDKVVTSQKGIIRWGRALGYF
jgi:hypothetical protein